MSDTSSSYAALAPIYNRIGYADFAREAVEHYIAHAQSLDWAGRRILDLGCGTGVSTWLLAERGFRVVGVEANPHMLTAARAYVQAQAEAATAAQHVIEPPDLVEMDIRTLESPIGAVDLVLAAGGVLNAILSLRELEQVFAHVNATLDTGQMFIFDVHTIYGLAHAYGTRDRLVYDADDLSVMVRHRFSYEALSLTSRYIIYQREEATWTRKEDALFLRGYPVQGVRALLERTGFVVREVLDLAMQPLDPQAEPPAERAIFVAQKRED